MAELAPLEGLDSPEAISGSFIVQFKDELSDTEVSDNLTQIRTLFDEAGGINSIKRVFNIGSTFRAFSATMDKELLLKVRSLPSIKRVEADQVVHAS